MIKGKITILLLLWFPIPSLVAQTFLPDSLKNLLSSTKNDSIKISLLSELCYYYINIDSTLAGEYCNTMLKEAEETKHILKKGDAFRIAGLYFNQVAKYDKAIEFFNKAKEIFKNIKSEAGEIGLAKILLNCGIILQYTGDFKDALLYYLDAEDISTKYNDHNTLFQILINVSDVYAKLNQNELAYDYYKKSFKLAELINDPKIKAKYYISLANYYTYQDNYRDAEKNYLIAKKIAEENNLTEQLHNFAYNFGFMLSRQEKYKEALNYYELSKQYAKKTGNKYDECDASYKIGLMHYYLKNYKTANEHLLKAIEMANAIKSKILIRNIYDVLSFLEAERYNYKTAYDYSQKYIDVVHKIFSEEDRNQVNFLNAKYESAKKESQIEQLITEKKIQTLEIEKRKNLIFFLSSFILLLIIVVYFILRSYKHKRKINEQNLLIHEQKIKELENEKQIAAIRYALQGEERERSRFARDLHDGLGGLLSGSKLAFNSYWESLRSSKEGVEINSNLVDSFKRASDLLSKSIIELQRVAHNMMPQALINSNIKEAVSEFCEQINSSGPLSVKFQFYGKECKIEQNYEISIYRTIQEFINNIIKHSEATEAFVQLVQEEDRISITVQDNGKGFDVSTINSVSGHGLKNIQLRVESLNGHFDVDSVLGKGTEISIEFENLDK